MTKKPFGIVRSGAEFSTISGQYAEQVEERNLRTERQCTSPRYVGSITEEGRPCPSIPLQAVRCRKCAGCLKMREAQWAYRAHIEHLLSERTWWITLTYRGQLIPTYEDVKKFFKKLRKAKHEFRYVISEEKGDENDRLHWHILIHCSNSLTRRTIERAWGLGFVNARLARSAGLGRYLAKYLAKQSRIRASQHYGGEVQIRRHLSEELNRCIERFIQTGSKTGDLVGSDVDITRFGVRIPREDLEHFLEAGKSHVSANTSELHDIPF